MRIWKEEGYFEILIFCLHRVEMGCVASISDEHTTSIIRAEVRIAV
jgi:hypothetical protein